MSDDCTRMQNQQQCQDNLRSAMLFTLSLFEGVPEPTRQETAVRKALQSWLSAVESGKTPAPIRHIDDEADRLVVRTYREFHVNRRMQMAMSMDELLTRSMATDPEWTASDTRAVLSILADTHGTTDLDNEDDRDQTPMGFAGIAVENSDDE